MKNPPVVPFVRDLDPNYGEAVQVSPLVRRVVANNPGPYTYLGTGTYLIGKTDLAVIDPGPDNDEHVAALLQAVEGQTITHIVVTHTHRDHSPASRALSEATGAPVWAFGPHPEEDDLQGADPMTDPEEEDDSEQGHDDAKEEPGDLDFEPDHLLRDGDLVRGSDWSLEAIHTPGHISNHLCFALPEEQALFSGDHVMGWSTTVISPPDGNMGDYMAGLDRLINRTDHIYWPTHGPPLHEPKAFVEALRAHRVYREAQIVEILERGPASVRDLVAVLYAHVDKKLHRAAGRSALSHLLLLIERGQVNASGDPLAPRTSDDPPIQFEIDRASLN